MRARADGPSQEHPVRVAIVELPWLPCRFDGLAWLDGRGCDSSILDTVDLGWDIPLADDSPAVKVQVEATTTLLLYC